MAEVTGLPTPLPSKRVHIRKIILWVVAVLCLGGLVCSLIVSKGIQFTSAKLPPRLILEKHIPLPGAFPDNYRTSQNPFAPGLAVLFDHFDFQALDPQTRLLIHCTFWTSA